MSRSDDVIVQVSYLDTLRAQIKALREENERLRSDMKHMKSR